MTEISELKSKIAEMSMEIEEYRHVLSHVIDCGKCEFCSKISSSLLKRYHSRYSLLNKKGDK
jgi:hypothetical protein